MFSKKLTMRPIYGATALLALIILVSACKRNKDDDNTMNAESTAYAEEQLLLEQIYDNADRVIERAFSLGSTALKGGENPLGVCANIKMDTTTNPDISRMTIEFGGTECLGYDGRYRGGRIIVDYYNKFKITDNGYYHKIVFDQYVVDGHKIGGYKEVWCSGISASGNIDYIIASVDTIYLAKSSGTLIGASERRRQWHAGVNTPQTNDDIYLISGFGRFKSPGGKESYIVEIVKPLVDALNCNWINEGVINIYPEGATQRVLDFGEGQCENDATINVNGVVRTVKIP